MLGEFLIADGAMGTQLQALGLVGDCPEVWNVERPDAVQGIHRRYVEAGARLVLTNTFGGSEWKLARAGHAADQARLCRGAAENARAAAGDGGFVLGDVGPTGKLPEPYGTHGIEEFESVFARQIGLLAAAGVHGVLVETMGSAAEAAAAVRAARRTCDLPVLATLTYSAGKRGYRTMMGETVEQGTEAVLAAGADVVGSNCGLGAGQMVGVIEQVRAVTAGPVLAKPNAGQPKLVDGETVFDEDAETWAAKAPALAAAGATIVGGCCGTTPDHIARAAALLHTSERA
ncbi:MAG: homocysteine S-methyltransferase family protein [Planctomycetota bacterium]